MDTFTLFQKLLHAETENEVENALTEAGYFTDDEDIWKPYGFENNFGAIGNQQSDPTGALIEKITNAIDATLMAACYSKGLDPQGAEAPGTMSEAVELFFGVPEGKLNLWSVQDQRQLAEMINLVAVGSKSNPNYLIIDQGEGQTPAKFPDTFLSLMQSNKIRIPFVQGKFNSGGTGVLQFCGVGNYQLIVSRRHPKCPKEPGDDTAGLWGFTIVRRLLPSHGRRSSMYVYLAPGGNVPTFSRGEIYVMPSKVKGKKQPSPYSEGLSYGTCIKLYDYRWKAKTIATTEARYEIEKYLHSSSLPFRITETREYRANYFSTTVTGGWTSAITTDEDGSKKLEPGFPAFGTLDLPGIGHLPYQIAVFTEADSADKRKRRPSGVYFTLNGQVHGTLSSSFVSTRLKLDNLSDDLLVSVSCTSMNERVREDFFMASRDRVRRNEVYYTIEEKLREALRDHPGLQELNQLRRKRKIEKHLEDASPVEAFQQLLNRDRSLADLFSTGDHLATGTGPAEKQDYAGRKFPSFFELEKNPEGGLVKPCPINRTCRVVFVTDAQNGYFDRFDNPGLIDFSPPDLVEATHLWNGRFEARFRVPWNAEPGDLVPVTVTVTDIERDAVGKPFVSTFALLAEDEVDERSNPGNSARPREPNVNGKHVRTTLALPNVIDIRKDDWDRYDFDQYAAISIQNDGKGGYDCFINVDNAFLLHEINRASDDDKPLIKFWFTWGIVLSAMGMIRKRQRQNEELEAGGDRHEHEEDVDLPAIGDACNGLSQVIIPIVRSLYKGPV